MTNKMSKQKYLCAVIISFNSSVIIIIGIFQNQNCPSVESWFDVHNFEYHKVKQYIMIKQQAQIANERCYFL